MIRTLTDVPWAHPRAVQPDTARLTFAQLGLHLSFVQDLQQPSCSAHRGRPLYAVTSRRLALGSPVFRVPVSFGVAKRKQAPGRKTQRSPDWARGLVRYERGTRHQGPHGAHTWGLARPSWTGARAGGTRRATTGQRTQETRARSGARLQPRRKRKSRERIAEKPKSAEQAAA